jgi:hypothetical protein
VAVGRNPFEVGAVLILPQSREGVRSIHPLRTTCMMTPIVDVREVSPPDP